MCQFILNESLLWFGYTGDSLCDENANTFNYKKQAYLVGLDKRFSVSQYNSLRLFVVTEYDDARSDNPAYKVKTDYFGNRSVSVLLS
ncbi:hypothetical protein C5469_10995 [Photorhabdus cinerea]|uniref:Uncharacterized protein n=1 Tax=Photorhabdus cinerea TaxID=471575 RepID=A0A7X5QE97_9GAMM|nr:hypothetical protein [Photorhabdus cinerea]